MKTVVPDVQFTFNQHRAYLLLIIKKNLRVFNRYASSCLTPEEKIQVLNSVKLNSL